MSANERLLVAAQLGRAPREPWRTAARCTWGFPMAIVSPSRLTDGTPFPTYAWLTCPWLAEIAGSRESVGAAAEWAARVAGDSVLAQALRDADAELRALRTGESGGEDACESVGLAGQRDPLGVKCLHAHIALALVGVDDPVGSAELGALESGACPDARCRKLAADAAAGG